VARVPDECIRFDSARQSISHSDFGPVVENQSVGFGTLWPPGNSQTIEQFWPLEKKGTGALLALKLISGNGDNAPGWLQSPRRTPNIF